MNELEFCTTDELVEELNRRHDIALFVGANPRQGTDEFELNYYMRGGFYNILGLIERMRRILNSPPTWGM